MISISELPPLIQEDMRQVDFIIQDTISSHVSFVSELGQHLIDSGGKRLRPLLVLLSARALGYEGTQHLLLASIMELVHTATLLHDDVVDGSTLRRGKPTANTLWGNQASVLVGDYLYSRVFQLMLDLRDLTLLGILADTTNSMVSGELQQLANRHNPDITEVNYLDVVYYKTAKLFETAARLGAVLGKKTLGIIEAMTNYGKCLGMSFQLIDDLLDYNGDITKIGKNLGDDLAEGKMTLPLIHVLQKGPSQYKSAVRQAIIEGRIADMAQIREALENTQAIDYTYRCAQFYSEQALQHLEIIPNSIYKEHLITLSQFALQRTS